MVQDLRYQLVQPASSHGSLGPETTASGSDQKLIGTEPKHGGSELTRRLKLVSMRSGS